MSKSLRFSCAVPRTYEEDVQRAVWTFRHQRVFCPRQRRVVHLRQLPEAGLAATAAVPSALAPGDDVLEFLGMPLPDDVACQIAAGVAQRFGAPAWRHQSVVMHAAAYNSAQWDPSKPTYLACAGDLDPITLQPFPAKQPADGKPSGARMLTGCVCQTGQQSAANYVHAAQPMALTLLNRLSLQVPQRQTRGRMSSWTTSFRTHGCHRRPPATSGHQAEQPLAQVRSNGNILKVLALQLLLHSSHPPSCV